jgi:hypothetical protein
LNPQVKSLLKLTAAVAFAALAAGFVLDRVNALRKVGEEGTCVWFYDQSEKRLYAVAADTLPPLKGTGGKSGDAVRAVVVTFPGGRGKAAERRIAYLETYTPELKDLLERIHAARGAGVRYEGSVPSRDSEFFQTNSLVKGPDEEVWHPADSAEAQAIVSEWRSWRSPEGSAPVVCVP